MIALPILTITAITITATIITINRNILDLPRRGASLNTGSSLQELFHCKKCGWQGVRQDQEGGAGQRVGGRARQGPEDQENISWPGR